MIMESGTVRTSSGSLFAGDEFGTGRFQRRHLNSGVLIKVSPIESLLQYRFATSKPLKTRPGSRYCKTAPLCNDRSSGSP